MALHLKTKLDIEAAHAESQTARVAA